MSFWLMQVLLGHSNWVRFVRFTEDCKRLVTGGDDAVTMIWSCPDGQIIQVNPKPWTLNPTHLS